MNHQLEEKIIHCNVCKSIGINFDEEREQNLKLAYNYKPDLVKVLWIVESPPKADPPRYFYRSELTRFDSLFRETMKALDIDITDPKDKALQEFQRLGHFLIDSMKCPADKSNSYLKPQMRNNCKTILKEEIVYLDPEKILIIKADVYNPAIELLYEIDDEYSELQISSRVLNNTAIPFPGSGQQVKFREAVYKFLNNI
jgi:hypothetical protein